MYVGPRDFLSLILSFIHSFLYSEYFFIADLSVSRSISIYLLYSLFSSPSQLRISWGNWDRRFTMDQNGLVVDQTVIIAFYL